MARYATFARFRTQQRSLRRTEPEDPRLEETAKKIEESRTTERSPEAERLKADLDARTETVKATAKDGTADDLLARTSDRRIIEEARTKAATMEPEDRIEVELAVTRTADVDLRAGASMLGRTTEPETVSKLETMTKTAADDIRTSTTTIRDIAPSTDLPAEVATVADTTAASTESIAGNVGEFVAMEQPDLTPASSLDAATGGLDMSRTGTGGGDADSDDGAAEPASMEFDPDAFDLGGDAGGTDHREVLEDFVQEADARADALDAESSIAGSEASISSAAVTTAGATIDAHMATVEVLGVEGGTAAYGVDPDYQLNDTSLKGVLDGISDEAQAKVDHQVAVERAELAELRADVSRDFADGVSDAFDDSALAGGTGVDVPPSAELEPYAEQVDAFAARAQVAAAEYEEFTSMRSAFTEHGAKLEADISVLEGRLAAAEANYAVNQTLSLETAAPGVASGGIDLVDHRLNQGAFDGAVDALRDLSTVQAELAAKRAVLTDVRAEVDRLDERIDDAEEDLERAEARLDEAQERLDEAVEAVANGDDLPDLDPDAVARADLEEVQDDIADLEQQLEEASDDAMYADADADVAEAVSGGQAAVTGALTGQDFSFEHIETEFIIVPYPPGTIPVSQTDEGVNDPALRSTLNQIERDLEDRAEAAGARLEADLAERREEELEARLDELRAAEAELAEEVPPEPMQRGADDEDDDGTPQLADVDPDVDLDLAATGGADGIAVEASVDTPEQVEAIPEPTQAVPTEPLVAEVATAAVAEPTDDAVDTAPVAVAEAESADLSFGVGATEAAGDDEPSIDPTLAPSEPVVEEVASVDTAPAAEPVAEIAQVAEVVEFEPPPEPAPAEVDDAGAAESLDTGPISMDRADVADEFLD